MGPGFVEELEVSRFHGVGPATAAKLHRLGIRTGRDLKACTPGFLQPHFGEAGAHFHAIARGVDERPVEPNRPRRASGSETTYPRDLAEPHEVEAGIAALADEVWDWCERNRWFGRTVTVKLRYADFKTVTRSRTKPGPVASRPEVAAASLDLVRGLFPLAKPVRLLGVTLSAAEATDDRDGAQPSFDFGPPGEAGR